MTTDLPKLKELAKAALQNQSDPVALNDYGMAVPPATVLGLIAEIERHRQVNTEGCKPESNLRPLGIACAGVTTCRSLDKAEGGTPDNIIIHPGEPTTPVALSEIKASENELMMAQVGLLAAVRAAYPVGSRLQIRIGQNTTEVVVKGHIVAWWTRPGYIQATNPKTGKSRTFPHSAVIEVLP